MNKKTVKNIHGFDKKIALSIQKNKGIKVFEAIENIKSGEKYDLILMDLEMPILNGYDTTKKIRNLDQYIPIIAMSANSFESEKEKAIQFSMNDYIDKPIDINNLKRILFKFYKK